MTVRRQRFAGAGATFVRLITGTVGTGKTSVADAAGDLLAGARLPHAVIDLDWGESRLARAVQ
jgi:hypothetical protein